MYYRRIPQINVSILQFSAYSLLQIFYFFKVFDVIKFSHKVTKGSK